VLVLKKSLAVLFNLSLISGVFPCVWKESNVVPLFKSGDKINISNYRGISILSAILKLFEKFVCDVITPVIRPSISDEQHGFVGGRSTVNVLKKKLCHKIFEKPRKKQKFDNIFDRFCFTHKPSYSNCFLRNGIQIR
jgi:hypothetical protein